MFVEIRRERHTEGKMKIDVEIRMVKRLYGCQEKDLKKMN